MFSSRSINLEDIIFERQDAEIFSITDTKARLDTLQNYFFPRLDALLAHALDFIQDIYGRNPHEQMTIVRRPQHRAKVAKPKDTVTVFTGVSGTRSDTPLKVRRPDGSPFFYHPTYLTFTVEPDGVLRVVLQPFVYTVDSDYVASVGSLFRNHIDQVGPVLAVNHIVPNTSRLALGLLESFDVGTLRIYGRRPAFVRLISPPVYFPADIDRGVWELVVAFIALYPLASSCVSIANGETPDLVPMLERFWTWYDEPLPGDIEPEDEEQDGSGPPDLSDFVNYVPIRSGLRWEIFARDGWTCRSCGRSPSRDGITLEVDHIQPRSKGGTGDKSNLQTLCRDCNAGKSNRDNTDLSTLA